MASDPSLKCAPLPPSYVRYPEDGRTHAAVEALCAAVRASADHISWLPALGWLLRLQDERHNMSDSGRTLEPFAAYSTEELHRFQLEIGDRLAERMGRVYPRVDPQNVFDEGRQPIQHQANWFRFLRERHLLILEWIAAGQSYEDIAKIFSMDPMQVQLISMTSLDGKVDRYDP